VLDIITIAEWRDDLNIAIASGKGGTGKTTVAVGLTQILDNCAYFDCDVEEPNGHLLLQPSIELTESVYKEIPGINKNRCNHCGKCAELCEFNALINIKFDIIIIEEMCHSCGACQYFCPHNALVDKQIKVGEVRKGYAKKDVLFFDGVLKIGEPSAAPVIKSVLKNTTIDKINIIDSPPGTSCSMIEATKISDFTILVTESTPMGLNDLKIAVNVLKQINVPFGVLINKFDSEFTQLTDYIEDNNLELLKTIPFDRKIASAYSTGEIKDLFTNEFISEFEELGKIVMNKINYLHEKIS
jgi:MinD superfamily P-loop ATPase